MGTSTSPRAPSLRHSSSCLVRALFLEDLSHDLKIILGNYMDIRDFSGWDQIFFKNTFVRINFHSLSHLKINWFELD